MKVSIITIVYNNKEHIADCIRSVKSQSYPNIEYIVIDGGSTDGTKDIIESFKKDITEYRSGPDSGLYDALNKGVMIATGDLIGVLHSDDIFYDDFVVENVVNKIITASADVIYGNGIYVDRNNPLRVRRIYSSRPFKRWYLMFGWIPLHTTIFVKRKLFEKHGVYDISYSISSDYDLSLKWFLESDWKTVFVNKYFVRMRLGGKSTTISLQIKKSQQDLAIINSHRLLGFITLMFKILRKIPQYIKPVLGIRLD